MKLCVSSSSLWLLLVYTLLSLPMKAESLGTTASAKRKLVAGMPGGWYDADANDPRVQVVALFAFQSLATSPFPQSFKAMSTTSSTAVTAANPSASFKIVAASQQVVAGMNYRLTMQVLNSQQDCVGTFSLTVYDHFGELSVTEWGELNVPCPPVVTTTTDKPIDNVVEDEEDPDE